MANLGAGKLVVKDGPTAANSEQLTSVRQSLVVLVVEDNPSDAELMQSVLHTLLEYDFAFKSFSKLQDALTYLKTATPDVILLDLNLPDSSGLQTLETMQSKHGEIPIVVITSVADEAMRSRILQSGAEDCIDKNDPPLRLLAHNVLSAIERHRAQRKQGDLEKVVQLNPDGIVVICDADKRICLQNKSAQSLFRDAEDQGIRDFIDTVTPEAGIVERKFVTDNGTFTCELRASHVTWEGKSARLIAVRDRTRERELADQVRESQKMNAIGRLAGGISHDFNNLLTVIIGYTDLLLRKRASEADVDEMLTEIQNAGFRAKSLTSQLLAFSRISSGQPQLLNVSHVIKDLQKMLTRIIGDDITLSIVPEGQVPQIFMDPGQFEQVIMNLVLNAREAMPSGGSITLKSETARITALARHDDDLKPGEYALVTVQDNGSGIGPEVLGQIFEPFYTTKVSGVGIGLGLATSYGIVKQYNGTIRVDSTVGVGTTFSVYIPASAEREISLHDGNSKSSANEGSGERILYVEDDEFVRKVTQLELIDAGYLVTTISGPLEAIDLIRKEGWHYDLLLSDVSMPDMTGVAMVHALREEFTPDIRAMFITGYTPDGESQIDNRSDDPVLQKPFEREALLSCIQDILRKAHSS